MSYIKSLSELSKDSISCCGVKASYLAELAQNDIPVPKGFVITSEAFIDFLEKSEVDDKVKDFFTKYKPGDKKFLAMVNAAVKAYFRDFKLPNDFTDELTKSFEDLNSPYVAVRSSAGRIDGDENFWKHKFMSFMNTDHEYLVGAIKACWSSLFAPDCIEHAYKAGLFEGGKVEVQLAVMVQEMFQVESSGICVMEDGKAIIKAFFGLGQGGKSGEIDPDTYTVNKQGFKALDVKVMKQDKKYVLLEEEGILRNDWIEIESEGDMQKLTENEIEELTKYWYNAEKVLGFPCVIEWGKTKDNFYVFQAEKVE